MSIHNEVYSRPVMAVLVKNKSISSLQKQIANREIQLMAEANMEVNTTLYFFSMREVKLKEQKIGGYFWDRKNKKWLHQDFSFPDILYIRCSIDKRYTQTFKKLCNYITKNNGKLITHDRFNKWLLYQIMSKDPVLKSYLPATRTFTHPDDLKKMLQHYKVIYLKSHFGRKGENVLRVEVLPDGGYEYSYHRFGQLTVISISDFNALLNDVKNFFQDRQFLIQQGIQLLKYNDRLIDMRAELQHNGDGRLEIVGVSVRLGQPGSPITTHGDAIRFDDFFATKMGYSKEQLENIRSGVQKFLFYVYKHLEDNYGKYAEIGIDFATDANNNIWFIEANARSTKASLNKAYGKAVLYRNFKNILEYARYLFNQSKRGVKKPAANNSIVKPTKPPRILQEQWRGVRKPVANNSPDEPTIPQCVPQERWGPEHLRGNHPYSQRGQRQQVRHYRINREVLN